MPVLSRTIPVREVSTLAAGRPAAAVLEGRGLHKRFSTRRGVIEAVRGVDLDLAAGEVLAFLGPNGAGKTTTIKMIAGLIRPDAGSVAIDGMDPHRTRAALARVGAVLEGSRNIYWRLTALENIEYFGVLRGLTRAVARQRGEALLARLGLATRADSTVQTLSRGMQQKVAIAVALVHEPPLLLLDEPTLGLDVESAQAVKQLVTEIAAEGRAVLLTTHQLEIAQEIAQRITIINGGAIIASAPTGELLARFTQSAVVIHVGGDIDAGRAGRLESLEARVDGRRIRYAGGPEGLYAVIDALRPVPIVAIEREREDLTRIFLKLVRREPDRA